MSNHTRDERNASMQGSSYDAHHGTITRSSDPALDGRLSAALETTLRGEHNAIFEPLEQRRLLSSVSLQDGMLRVDGDKYSPNQIYIHQQSNSIKVEMNGQTRGSYNAGDVDLIVVVGGEMDDGINVMDGLNRPTRLYGNGGNDGIHGNDGPDTIWGGRGNDEIWGVGGNDVIDGESGTDWVDGGAGWDSAKNAETTQNIESGGGGGSNAFQESGGRVDFEAEAFTGQGAGMGVGSSSTWNVYSDSGASGGKGIVASPNTGVTTGEKLDGARRDFAVNFGTTGTYYVWVRMQGANNVDDSIHVGLDGNATSLGKWGVSPTQYNQWQWVNEGGSSDRLKVNVSSAGVHQFNIWMREDGVKVDQVILTKDANFNPNGGSGSGGGGGDSGGGGGGGGDSGGGGGGGDTNAPRPTAKISAVSSLNIMAGVAVHVNALGTTFNAGDMDTARFEWDFGDSNGKRNSMVGWSAAHLYENPGTYTIKLKVWNEKLGYDESTVTVNVAQNTRKKIYVSSNSGSDSNSGSSSSPVRTIPRAVDLMKANNGNAEILLKRGERFDLAQVMSVDRGNVVIGAYGSGNRPVVNWTRGRYDTKGMFQLGWGVSNLTIRDLAFDTPYGGDTSSHNMPHAVSPAGTNISVINNEFRHIGDAVNGNLQPKAVLVQGNSVPGDTYLRRYFTWIEGSDWTVTDNTVPNSTREHIVRMGNGTRFNVSHNNFGNKDRRDSGDPYDYAKGVLNIQKGSYAYIAHNVANGPSGVGPLGDGDGLTEKSARFLHAVFEGNRLNGQFIVEHGAEDIEVRNNIFNSDHDLTVTVEGYDATYGRGTRNVRFANNTGINTRSSGQFMRIWSGTSNLVVSNNLYYAPNLVAGHYGTAVLRVDASSLNGFSKIDNNVWADAEWIDWAGGLMWVGTGSDNSGYLDKNQWLAMPQVHSDKFSDSPIDGSFRPQSGSTAATAGDPEPGVMVDFYGKWRPNQTGRTAGAVTL